MLAALILLALWWVSERQSIQYGLVLPSSLALITIGSALLLVGVAIRIAAFVQIPSTFHIHDLVTSGIYAKTRKPIYLAFAVIVVAIAVLSRGVFTYIWAVIGVVTLYWIAKKEEDDLERLFGDRYREYKRTVPMFLPRFRQ